MNLTAALGKTPSMAQAKKLAQYASSHPHRFAELVQLFLQGPYRLTQRAAGPLLMCIQYNPGLALPHLRTFIKQVGMPGQHDSIKRNLLRVLQHIDLPAGLQGMAADTAFRLLTNRSEAVAIRVFAMTVLARIAQQQPELARELCTLIEDELPYGTAAFVSRGSKTLKLLRGIR
jgi:hypothetical protein